MKTMNCKQLGGACENEFHANSFDEIAEMSKQHGMEMFQKKDEAHLKAMNEMQARKHRRIILLHSFIPVPHIDL